MKKDIVYGIDWSSLGLRKNPYDTNPLQEGGDVSMNTLFIGREEERGLLDGFFASEDGGCSVVCGDVGVGKTSLVNFEKFDWKTVARPRFLFSSRSELQATRDSLTKQKFLLNSIASLLREISLIDPELSEKEGLLTRLSLIIDVVNQIDRSMGVSTPILGISGGYGHSVSQPIQLSDIALESWFKDLITLIRSHEVAGKHYEGVVIHMNNFDIMTKSKEDVRIVVQFFNEIRDILQIPYVFFVFIGPLNFFQSVIYPEPRVSGIFPRSPIILQPLSKTQLIEAVDRRLDAFRAQGIPRAIKPVSDDVISKLYDIYNGDVRAIFNSLKQLVERAGESFVKTLGLDEAITLLSEIRSGELNKFSPTECLVLDEFIQASGPLTQTQIAERLKKQPSYVIATVSKFKNLGVVDVVERVGKNKLLDLTPNYQCLRENKRAQERMRDRMRATASQLSLDI
jgi:hypothetical protein